MTEDQLEQEALGWLAEVGYTPLYGPDIAPDGEQPERADYRQVLLPGRSPACGDSTASIPDIPAAARAGCGASRCSTWAFLRCFRPTGIFTSCWWAACRWKYQKEGETRGDFVRLIDWSQPGQGSNDWLAINQFSIKGPHHTRRPDIILFVERPAAGAAGTEEPGRRERRHLESLRPDSDLQGTDPRRVPVQRAAGHFGWQRGAAGFAVQQRRALHAVAHD